MITITGTNAVCQWVVLVHLVGLDKLSMSNHSTKEYHAYTKPGAALNYFDDLR